MFILENGRAETIAGGGTTESFVAIPDAPARLRPPTPDFPGRRDMAGSSTESARESGREFVPCGNFRRTPVSLLAVVEGTGDGGGELGDSFAGTEEAAFGAEAFAGVVVAGAAMSGGAALSRAA
jgi:hypothetical protein